MGEEEIAAGSVRIGGRGANKKNANIEGVYVLRDSLFEGFKFYEKVGSSGSFFIFYSSRKQRWKISDTLDDAKGGYAYAKVKSAQASAPSELPAGTQWHVFEGKQAGYEPDAGVFCRPAEKGTEIIPETSAKKLDKKRTFDEAKSAWHSAATDTRAVKKNLDVEAIDVSQFMDGDTIKEVPADHPCHSGTRFDDRGGPQAKRYQFAVANPAVPGTRINFQATVRSCGGNDELSRRIAHLCYVQLFEGVPKEEVVKIREALCAKARAITNGSDHKDTGTAEPAKSPKSAEAKAAQPASAEKTTPVAEESDSSSSDSDSSKSSGDPLGYDTDYDGPR